MKSLLEIVQDILSDMGSDPVNTLDDTEEAMQVATIVKNVFYNITANRDWNHTKRLLRLEPSGDHTRPTHLKVVDTIKKVQLVTYDKSTTDKKVFQEVRWIDNDDFLRVCSRRDSSAPFTETIVDYNGVELLINTNSPPTYLTSFDDKHIVFDSYDKSVDDTIQQHKVQAIAYIQPIFEMVDDYIPDLPIIAFPALIEESTARAFAYLKQEANQIAMVESRRQQAYLSGNSRRVKGQSIYPSYGRGRVKHIGN